LQELHAWLNLLVGCKVDAARYLIMAKNRIREAGEDAKHEQRDATACPRPGDRQGKLGFLNYQIMIGRYGLRAKKTDESLCAVGRKSYLI
jgi:hypothetical protein